MQFFHKQATANHRQDLRTKERNTLLEKKLGVGRAVINKKLIGVNGEVEV